MSVPFFPGEGERVTPRRALVHEFGHAIVAARLGFSVDRICLTVPINGNAGGQTECKPTSEPTRDQGLMLCVAGAVSEALDDNPRAGAADVLTIWRYTRVVDRDGTNAQRLNGGAEPDVSRPIGAVLEMLRPLTPTIQAFAERLSADQPPGLHEIGPGDIQQLLNETKRIAEQR